MSARTTFAFAAAPAVAICCSRKRALARSALLEIYIPFEEAAFLEKSVDFANKDWRAPILSAPRREEGPALHVAPLELGPTREGEDPYERNNRWLYCASARIKVGSSACGAGERQATDRAARST